MRPGDAGGDPIMALVRALAPDTAADGVGLPELAGKHMTSEELAEYLASGGNPTFVFARTLRDLADTGRTRLGLLPHEQARLVLLIDQLDELVTRPEIGAEQRSLFARTVAALADSGAVWVIATVRSDLWHRLEEVKELRDLAERGARLALAAPDAAQLFDIIRKPAQAAGVTFDTEPGTELTLDAMIAREAEVQPGVLPLLSVLLDELYDRDVAHGGNAVLTVASYRALGGLHAAIGRRAESRLLEIHKTDPAAAAALPGVLRTLVTVTASGDALAARSAPVKTFAEASPERRLVDALIAPDARLLTAENRGRGPEVRLAHEALIENWPRAKEIVAESGHFIRLRDDIDAQRRKWQAAQRRPELLLASGLPLAEARDLMKRFGAELSPELFAFIKASRRRARRHQELAAAAAMLVVIIAGSGVWWWDQNLRIKTEYCVNYGERWGVPFCVGPLDTATRVARHTSYRFITQGVRVLELTRVNGSDYPIIFSYYSHPDEAWNNGVAQWRFTYLSDAPGTEPLPASVAMEGPTGVSLRQVSYTYSDDRRQAIARFDGGFGVDEGQAGAGSRLGLAAYGTQEVPQRSQIRRHLLSFDAAGRLLRRDFLPATGFTTIADAVGSHGRVYAYDDEGLPARMRNLDGQGNTLIEKSGAAERLFVYDKRGDMVTGAWLGRDGQLRANEQNFARFVWTRDRVGNIVEEGRYTKAGYLIARTDLGVAGDRNTYDARGNLVDQSYFDASRYRTLNKNQGIARSTGRFDERGRVIEIAYFGLNGEPVLDKTDGVARAVYKNDRRGNRVEEAFFGTDGKPILTKRLGTARDDFRYDEHGNRVEETYFGTDGKPILSKNGHARLTMRYENGNKVEEAFFGTDGTPVLHKQGYARIIYRYDDRRNLVEWADFGVDGRPIANNTNAVARTTYSYDERGNKVEEAYFGVDGMLTAGKLGYARVTYQYDERGNQTELADFGADGNPAANSNGIARTTRSYDERGNMVEEAYFGVDGRPTFGKLGYARGTIKYDERDNRIELAFFDTDRKPVTSSDGVARETRRYDERGNIIEFDNFGADGNPVLSRTQGVSRIVVRRDERGNMVEQKFFGIDGKPVRLKGEKGGYAAAASAYDERDNIVEIRYFGIDGGPVPNTLGHARITRRYDDRGNMVEEAHFGVDAAPPVPDAVRLFSEYDAGDRVIRESSVDALGQPAMYKPFGIRVAEIRYRYNPANEQSGTTYVDEHGRIIPVEVECQTINPGSAAERIGLAAGDRLLRYDDQPIQSTPQFIAIVDHAAPGVHKLTVRHSGATTTYEVPRGKLGVNISDVLAAPPSAGAALPSPP
jgi:hypothetical protein